MINFWMPTLAGVLGLTAASWAASSPITMVEQALPLLGVDDYRKAITQREAAYTWVRLGRFAEAEEVLGKIVHYIAPSTVADSILLGWDKVPPATLARWFGMADDKMVLTIGRDSEEPATQLGKLWSVFLDRRDFPKDSRGVTPKFMAGFADTNQKAFRAAFQPSLWTRIRHGLNPRSAWGELRPAFTSDEKKLWKATRLTDGFSARILLAEASRRVQAGETYPPSWISFATGGMDATSFNSDPARLAVDCYRLALLEKNVEVSTRLRQRLRIMLPQATPTAFGAYEMAMAASLACGRDGAGKEDLLAALADLQGRAAKYLNEYEKMLVYPQLGAGFVILGKPEQGALLFQQVMAMADKNTDPESKRIGCIRLELGLALAGVVPTADQFQKLIKIMADADQG